MNQYRVLLTAITLSVLGCRPENPRLATTLNTKAVLAGGLSTDPLTWKTIASGLNPGEATMSTLFGNDRAAEYARTRGDADYPRGSELALVTWRQQEDIRWFGARIPAEAKSVETVTVASSEDGRTTYQYQRFQGRPLKLLETSAALADERVTYLLSQRAAVMP